MKKVLSIGLLFISLVCFGQEETNVKENNEKIGELNTRLDRLINGSTQISGDSINIKIDRLINEVREIKSEMLIIKEAVHQINERTSSRDNSNPNEHDVLNEEGNISSTIRGNQSGTNNQANGNGIAALEDKINEIDNGKYYVIIWSERTIVEAKNTINQHLKSYQVKILQNDRKSWHHVVLDQLFSMAEAIKKTNEIRKGSIKDAWWLSARKFVQ
jgi:hypothetical protein